MDVYGFRKPTIAMEWMGKHALMIYVLVACNILPMFIRGFYWRDPNNSLVSLTLLALHFLLVLATDLCASLHLELNLFFLVKLMCFVASSTEPFFFSLGKIAEVHRCWGVKYTLHVGLKRARATYIGM